MIEWRVIEKLPNGARYRKFVDGKPTNGYKLIMGADPSIDEQVGASADDCDVYKNAGVWVFSTTENFCTAGYYASGIDFLGCGMRFQSVAIPQGATIDTAKITLRCGYTTSGTVCRTRFRGEDIDDAAAFSTQANYLGRDRTSAYVDWDGIPAWTINTDYEGPEIKSCIQEIVDRVGWVSGNDMVIFWDDHDDRSDHNDYAGRWAYSYNGSVTYAPKIHIEYTEGLIELSLTDGLKVGDSRGVEIWETTEWQNTLVTNDTYYADLTELDPNTEYEFQTQAKNEAGESEWSESAYFTTILALLSVVDSISIGDSRSESMLAGLSRADALESGDTTSLVGILNILDGLELGDSSLRSMIAGLSRTDGVSAGDSFFPYGMVSRTDGLELGSSLSLLVNMFIAASDELKVGDSGLLEALMSLICADGLTLSDIADIIYEGVTYLSITDNLKVGDTRLAEMLANIQLADSTKIGDIANILANVQLSDGTKLGDAAQLLAYLEIEDGIELEDSPLAEMFASLLRADGIELSDVTYTVLGLTYIYLVLQLYNRGLITQLEKRTLITKFHNRILEIKTRTRRQL